MPTKQISAVDWLVNELKTSIHYQRVINEVNQSNTQIKDVINQAKAMEKEQIEDNKDEYRWTYSEIFDACFPTLGRGGDWAAIAKRLIEQKENKKD